MARTDWSKEEVDLIVADYFDMLRSELLGLPYKKAEHRRALMERLNNRSKGSIEFKHQNISAVMVELGLPYVEGYKPRGNYQALLADSVKGYLDNHPRFLTEIAQSPLINPDRIPSIYPSDLTSVLEPPPEQIVTPREPTRPWIDRKPSRIDFAARDAGNRRLGQLGEQWVLELERTRLLSVGRDDLAKKVDWVAQSIGDGLGFDVLSFNETDDSERLIEVKTTGLGKYFPFYVTRNEVRCSEDIGEQFHLYRVFNFSRAPRLYVLRGSLRATCRLEAVQFVATRRGGGSH